jgi:hypothetical protein
MKKIFSISLISLSVSILLLHSFVPHHHSPDKFNLQEILKNEPVKSPIDLLKVGFHLNLGANHLENFQKNKSLITEKNSIDQEEVNPLFTIPTFQSNSTHFKVQTDILFSQKSESVIQHFLNSFSYRGPPISA